MGPIIPTVQYGNPTNRRTGLSTRDENEIDEEYIAYQRRQVRKERRGLKKDIQRMRTKRLAKPSHIKKAMDLTKTTATAPANPDRIPRKNEW